VPKRYVAGADNRGRQEGRPYPWSQQVIHEISGFIAKALRIPSQNRSLFSSTPVAVVDPNLADLLQKRARVRPPIIVPNGIDKAMLIMMGLHSHSLDQVPFASPLGFAREAISNDEGRTIMINNSSLQKWDRLAQKQLDQQFMNEIIHGLQCSPFEAKAVLEAVYKVYGPYFETSGHLKPGQILFQVISIDEGPSARLANSKQVTVTLTLDAGEEDLQIRKKHGVVGLRQHRLERVCTEAFQQGGLLTVEDLAYRLFNCGQRTLCRDLEQLKAKDIILPLRSTIKDMGRSISHRAMIVEQWLQGKEYSDISRNTHHSVAAVKNYIQKFKRVIGLAEQGFDVHTIGFLVKLSPALVEQYYQLYRSLDMVAHRKAELKNFLKKNVPNVN